MFRLELLFCKISFVILSGVYGVEGMTEHRKSEIVTSDELRVQKPLSKKACHNSLFRRRWRV